MTNQDGNTFDSNDSDVNNFSDLSEESRIGKATPSIKTSKKKLKIIYFFIGGSLLFVVLVLFLLFDPLGFVSSFYQESSIVPRKAIYYTNINLLSFLDQNVEDTLAVFSNKSTEQIKNRNELLEKFDKVFDEDFGITINSDIKPWIGKSAAFYISDPKGNYPNNLPNDLDGYNFTLIIKVNNFFAADQFVEKLKSGFISKQKGEITDRNYSNIHIYSFINKEKHYDFSIARVGKLLLISDKPDGIIESIDSQGEKSLQNDISFQQISKVLPADGNMFIYFPSSSVSKLINSTSENLSVPGIYSPTYKAVGMSIKIDDPGFLIESASSYDLDKLTSEEKEYIEEWEGSNLLAKYYPENTFIYLGGNHLDLLWISIRKILERNIGSITVGEFMKTAESGLGFNLDKDLFPALDGHFAIGLFSQSSGVLPETLSLDVGTQMVIESSDSDALRSYSSKIFSLLENSDEINIKHNNSQKLESWDISIQNFDSNLISYGINKNAFIISSDTKDMQNAFSRSKSLEDSNIYKTASSYIGKDLNLVCFIDFQEMVTKFSFYNQSIPILGGSSIEGKIKSDVPILSIIVGAEKFQKNIQRTKTVIIVDK